jgi:hypothetical protein
MSPRNTSLSAWGMSTDGFTTRRLVAAGAVVLLAGIVFGWFIGHVTTNSAAAPIKATASSVVEPTIIAFSKADKSQDGAARAVSSLITALPDLSLKTSDVRSTALGQIVSPNASADLSSSMAASLNSLSDQLQGPTGSTHPVVAKLIVTPLTYKVEMSGDKAHVVLWYNGVILDPTISQSVSKWATVDVDLVWTDHWRLMRFDTTVGPTPQVVAQNGVVSEYSDVVRVFDGFKAYRSAIRS